MISRTPSLSITPSNSLISSLYASFFLLRSSRSDLLAQLVGSLSAARRSLLNRHLSSLTFRPDFYHHDVSYPLKLLYWNQACLLSDSTFLGASFLVFLGFSCSVLFFLALRQAHLLFLRPSLIFLISLFRHGCLLVKDSVYIKSCLASFFWFLIPSFSAISFSSDSSITLRSSSVYITVYKSGFQYLVKMIPKKSW